MNEKPPNQHVGLNNEGDKFGQSPCGAFLSLPLCLCLHPTPTHQSSSKPVWSEGTCFHSCFHHFMSDRSVFPMSNPSLGHSSLKPLSCFPSSNYPPPSLTVRGSKSLANVLNVQFNTHALVEAVPLRHLSFNQRRSWGGEREERGKLI